jgi:hypothetical protein
MQMQRSGYGILASEVIAAINLSQKRLPQWKADFLPIPLSDSLGNIEGLAGRKLAVRNLEMT